MLINDVEFSIEIKRKRIKNSYLRVKGNNIEVSVPFGIPGDYIINFIENKKEWIYKAYTASINRTADKKTIGDDYIYIFSKRYELIKSTGKNRVFINGDKVYLTYKKDDEDKMTDYLYKSLNKILVRYINEYIDKYRNMLIERGYALKPDVKMRIMKSRWGVCHIRKNLIVINSSLIHYDLQCLEYIVLHELVHFIVPNHGKSFYSLVSYFMPDYKQRFSKLK